MAYISSDLVQTSIKYFKRLGLPCAESNSQLFHQHFPMASEGAMRTYLAEKVESELLFIWGEKEIELADQYKLAQARVTKLSRFASIEDDRDKFRALMTKLCALDPESVDGRIVLSDLVTCWEAARTMNKAEIESKAQAAISGSKNQVPVPKRTYLAMESAFRKDNGKKPPSELPGEPLMTSRLAMIEDNDPKAEPLSDMASLEDGADEITFAECDISGALRRGTRKMKQVPLPDDPEKLRAYYIVMENSFLYARYRHNNTQWLSDVAVGTFEKVVKYLLGRKVYRLEAAAENGQKVPWSAVLKYEFQIRKRAMELVKEEGMKLGAALDEAMQDSEVRALYFTANITLNRQRGTGKGSGQYEDEPPLKKLRKGGKGDHNPTKIKGSGKKAKGTGKSKGRGMKGGLLVAGATPDGRLLCYKWNEGLPCDGGCGMLHVCRVVDCWDANHCMVKHPGFDASKKFENAK